MKTNQKGFINILILVVAILAIGAVGYFTVVKKETTKSTPGVDSQKTETTKPTTVVGEAKTNVAKTETQKIVEKKPKIIVSKLDYSQGKHPKFSNDGTKIVYRVTNKDAGLWVVNSDGTGLKKLTNDAIIGGGVHDFQWSSNGKFVFYLTRSMDPLVPSIAELKVVNMETGEIKSLFKVAGENFYIQAPKWISQKEIAFINLDESNLSNSSVKVVDIDSGKLIQPSNKVALYFWKIESSTTESGSMSTIVMVTSDGVAKVITSPGAISFPFVSADGKVIYVSKNGLVTMNGDGSNPKIISSEFKNGSVVLSNDGKRVVYEKITMTSDGHGILESDIYAMNIDGTNEKRLTYSENKKQAVEASWSSDDKKIVFYYVNTGEIATIDVE